MIICDTNIWYNIGSGLISANQIPNEDLVFTYISLREMASSKNLYKNEQSVSSLQNAVISVRKYASKYVFDNPFDIVYSKLKGTKNTKVTDGEEVWNILKHLHKYPISQILSDKIMPVEGAKRLELNDKQADFFNSENIARKEYVKENKLKGPLAKSDHPLQFVKSSMVDFLNESYLNDGNSIDINDSTLNWDSIELAMETWSSFEKDLLRSGQKLEFNDIGDLMNMTYVNQGDKYWTSEKQWTKRILENPKTMNYLFQLN